MIKINLVPKEILDKARQRQIARQAAVAGVLALLLLGGVSTIHYLTLRELEKKTSEDSAKLKQLQAIVSKVEELQKDEAAIRSRLDVINSLLKGRPLYPYFMSDLAKSMPAGVQIRSLNTSGGGNSDDLRISLTAQAASNEDIAAWINAMQNSGRFGVVQLGAVTAQDSNAAPVYNFSLNSLYTPSL